MIRRLQSSCFQLLATLPIVALCGAAHAGWYIAPASMCQVVANGTFNPVPTVPIAATNTWEGRPVGNSGSAPLELYCGVDQTSAFQIDDGVNVTTLEVDVETASTTAHAYFQLCSDDYWSSGGSCDGAVYSVSTGNQAMIQSPLTNWINNVGNYHYFYVSIPQVGSGVRGVDGFYLHN